MRKEEKRRENKKQGGDKIGLDKMYNNELFDNFDDYENFIKNTRKFNHYVINYNENVRKDNLVTKVLAIKNFYVLCEINPDKSYNKYATWRIDCKGNTYKGNYFIDLHSAFKDFKSRVNTDDYNYYCPKCKDYYKVEDIKKLNGRVNNICNNCIGVEKKRNIDKLIKMQGEDWNES